MKPTRRWTHSRRLSSVGASKQLSFEVLDKGDPHEGYYMKKHRLFKQTLNSKNVSSNVLQRALFQHFVPFSPKSHLGQH